GDRRARGTGRSTARAPGPCRDPFRRLRGRADRALPRVGLVGRPGRPVPGRGREPGRRRAALRARMAHRARPPRGDRPRRHPRPRRSLRARRGRRRGSRAARRRRALGRAVHARARRAGAGGRATRSLGAESELVKRLLKLLAAAQVLRWAALELWGQEYQQGDADAGAVIDQANGAAARIRDTAPQDPTLLTTRAVLVSMFTEYAKAVRAKENGKDAGPSIARAYTLANTAHE